MRKRFLIFIATFGALHASSYVKSSLGWFYAPPKDEALFNALKLGHKEHAELLVNESRYVLVPDEYGNTTLILAAMRGYDYVVKKLIKKGADLRSVTDDGNTALLLAADFGRLTTVDFLIENGAEIDRVNKWGYTPLIISVMRGHYKVVEMLLYRNASVNIQDKSGRTAFGYAQLYNNVTMMRLLRRYKAK